MNNKIIVTLFEIFLLRKFSSDFWIIAGNFFLKYRTPNPSNNKFPIRNVIVLLPISNWFDSLSWIPKFAVIKAGIMTDTKLIPTTIIENIQIKAVTKFLWVAWDNHFQQLSDLLLLKIANYHK